MARYRPWLYGAAVYNLCWGFGAVLLAESSGWKVVGMMVAVYAPAYWWAARFPERHAHLVVVGLLGKTLGLLGYAAGVATGAAPAALGFVVLANDLVWWPAFVGFVRSAARAAGGWRALLVG
jgi:hypothetical protein